MATIKAKKPSMFAFQVDVDGEISEYRMPALNSLTISQLKEFADAASAGEYALISWFTGLVQKYAPEACDVLLSEQLGELLEAYQDGGVAGK